jgi:hypothetical protein
MATRAVRILLRLALLAAVTGAAVLAYLVVVEPWYHNWGATTEELVQPLPGDNMVPQPYYQSTRAITINAAPEAIWPWLVQWGQERGGLYSYEFLENLIGCDMHNADRIHPEWQNIQVGDTVRFIPAHYLGMEPPSWTVDQIVPNGALVLKPWAAFVLHPIDAHTTRLIIRARAQDAATTAEPFNFIMMRRTLIGIKDRAEGTTVPSVIDGIEVALWAVAFLVSILAGFWTVTRPAWPRTLAVLLAAIAVLFFVVFWRPPLPVGAILDLGLVGALWWAHGRAAAIRPTAAVFKQPEVVAR